MSTRSIFAGSGTRAEFVNKIYTELIKRNFVSYADVLTSYYKRPPGYYDKKLYNSERAYGTLKKAFHEVLKALRAYDPNCLEDNGKKGRGRAYRYTGEAEDPLEEERKAIVQKSIEDYVAFCKASAGIMPTSWFSSFFENTQILLDTNREEECGTGQIRSSLEQNLKNLHLLPEFYRAISDKQVLQFSYRGFGQESYILIFHPQYLKEYNGRWFVFGEANREPFKAYNVPLDRIEGNINIIKGIDYIPAENGFYQAFFKNIIGVTREEGANVEEVVIRTKSEYLHGLLMTKPIHPSQQELLPYGEHESGWYGEVSLIIEPNRELRGKILLFGEGLEVIKPQSLREQIILSLKKQLEQYGQK